MAGRLLVNTRVRGLHMKYPDLYKVAKKAYDKATGDDLDAPADPPFWLDDVVTAIITAQTEYVNAVAARVGKEFGE